LDHSGKLADEPGEIGGGATGLGAGEADGVGTGAGGATGGNDAWAGAGAGVALSDAAGTEAISMLLYVCGQRAWARVASSSAVILWNHCRCRIRSRAPWT
jgi:hypothetical protein